MGGQALAAAERVPEPKTDLVTPCRWRVNNSQTMCTQRVGAVRVDPVRLFPTCTSIDALAL